jgi:hypothetical protein
MANVLVRWTALLLAAASTLFGQREPSIIGDGWGLDHVLVMLPDASVLKDVFQAKLGFSPEVSGEKFPEDGLEHAIIWLPPTNVELLWPYQEPTKLSELGRALLAKAKSGGGPVAYNLDVSPATQAADVMKRLGIKVTLPPSLKVKTADGKEAPGDWQFVDIDPKYQAAHILGVPGGAGVGFSEYQHNSYYLQPESFQESIKKSAKDPDPRRTTGEIHANTARKLSSVWVAVPNAAEAVRQSERFGFVARGERYVKELGAKGREVQCGRGTIVFFESANPGSGLATAIKKNGLGPFGFSVAVHNLRAAKQVVENATNGRFAIEQFGNRSSFVVPASIAAGNFIEFVQE